MKNTKRALRRHHRQRMIRRAMHSLVLFPWGGKVWNEAEQRRKAVHWADHLKMCSCYMCGNLRTGHGPNRQEIRESERANANGFYPVTVDKKRVVCYVSPTLFNEDTEEQAL